MKHISIGKGEGGQVRVRYFHNVYVKNPHPKSYTSLVLLQNKFLLLDKDYLESDWRIQVEFSRTYLQRKLKENGCLTCVYCGKTNLRIEIDDNVKVPRKILATLDHIIPFSKGGTNAETNLAVACYRCNIKKGSHDVADFIRIYKDRCNLIITI
jgi:5-methylcytosine-specific restriction endonuclease McrA